MNHTTLQTSRKASSDTARLRITRKIIFALLTFINNIIITAPQETTADHTITVFVHGTFPIRKLLQFSPGRSLIYSHQGLNLAKKLPEHYHFHKMAQECVNLHPQSYSMDQFYIFGWKSEKVYDSTRQQAAKDLVQELQKLVDIYYKDYNLIPSVQLIGFSHGGNVVLHTATYLPLIVNNKKIEVEAWIFGTPVQQVNCHLINSENFNKIYSFHSKSDWIQRMDAQGLYNKKLRKTHFWSDRMFDQNSQCIQVDFTVNGKSISHCYYRSIFKYLPEIQKLVESKSCGLKSGCIAADLSTKKNKSKASKIKA